MTTIWDPILHQNNTARSRLKLPQWPKLHSEWRRIFSRSVDGGISPEELNSVCPGAEGHGRRPAQ